MAFWVCWLDAFEGFFFFFFLLDKLCPRFSSLDFPKIEEFKDTCGVFWEWNPSRPVQYFFQSSYSRLNHNSLSNLICSISPKAFNLALWKVVCLFGDKI